MNTDIRLKISFKDHRKRKRLRMILGPGSTDYLIDLWLSVAVDRPDGVLTGWDEIDIALSCGWDDDPNTLVSALLKTGWLDQLDDGTYTVHGWGDHQQYASNSKLRSDAARKAAEKRWGKRLKCGNSEKDELEKNQSKRDVNADLCEPHADRIESAMRPLKKGNAPNPNPTPTPTPTPERIGAESANARKINNKRKKFVPPTKPDVVAYFEANGYTAEAGAKAWDYYEAGGWKDARGQPVKSWKQKMQGVWFKPENKTRKAGSDEFSEKTYTSTPDEDIGWLRSAG